MTGLAKPTIHDFGRDSKDEHPSGAITPDGYTLYMPAASAFVVCARRLRLMARDRPRGTPRISTAEEW